MFDSSLVADAKCLVHGDARVVRLVELARATAEERVVIARLAVPDEVVHSVDQLVRYEVTQLPRVGGASGLADVDGAAALPAGTACRTGHASCGQLTGLITETHLRVERTVNFRQTLMKNQPAGES